MHHGTALHVADLQDLLPTFLACHFFPCIMKLLYTLQDLLPVLGELRNALSMRKELEKLVEAGNFCKVEFSIDVTVVS